MRMARKIELRSKWTIWPSRRTETAPKSSGVVRILKDASHLQIEGRHVIVVEDILTQSY